MECQHLRLDLGKRAVFVFASELQCVCVLYVGCDGAVI
jgi:hypothetical protein